MSGTVAPGRVLIVGAGPVGLLTALLLARAGAACLVLEARSSLAGTGSRAICFQRDVLDILERVGCGEAAVAGGVTWWRGRTFHRGQELFQTTFPETAASAFPPFVNISQSAVEELLAERVRDEPLIELRLSHPVAALTQDDAGVTVRCEGVAGEEVGDYLVACDGVASGVRNLLGLPFPGDSFRDRFLIADIRTELPFPPERHFHFDPVWNPERQVLVHPQPDGVWRIDWQVPENFDLDAERSCGGLEERIRRITDAAPFEIVWLSVYRFHQRLAPALRFGRVLLAGDAAHVMSPFGARGLNSGAQDAENAAWKLAALLWGHGGPGLLDSYHQERFAAARENLRVTSQTMRFLVPATEAEHRHRRTVLEQAVRLPEACSQVDSGKLAEPYWYLDSALTTADGDPQRDFPTQAGAVRPIVPGVLCPDAPCRLVGRPEVRRLRQLFGDRFVWLVDGTDAGPARAASASVDVPAKVHRLIDLDPSSDAGLAAALAIPAGRATLVRPDGHIAAMIDATDHAALRAALLRACGGS